MEKPVIQEEIRNPDGTFKPGVSGNPAGRPKGKTLKEFARELLMSMTDEEKVDYLATIPKEVLWKMAEGNPAQDMTSGGDKIQQFPIYGSLSRHNSDQADIPTEEKD